MLTEPIVAEAEEVLAAAADFMLSPHDRECLICYVSRMIDEFGCRGNRFMVRYRDLRVPNATGMLRRLGQMGGYCDCELFLNAYEFNPAHLIPGYEIDHGEYVEEVWPRYPEPFPDCLGVRRGSTQPCNLWIRMRKGR